MNMLAVYDLAIRRSSTMILEHVSFSARKGEVLALMGVSGTGKTTLLRAVAGLDPIAAGTIDVAGITLTPERTARRRILREVHKLVGVVFQFHHLFSHMSALHNVSLAPVHVLRQPRAAAERRARELLEQLGVASRAEAMPHELSGGEAQRVAIARALAVEPPILLMDEPTASLDRTRRDELAETLRQLAAEGRTVVVATHDADFVRACAPHAVVLGNGRIIADGATSEVLHHAL